MYAMTILNYMVANHESRHVYHDNTTGLLAISSDRYMIKVISIVLISCITCPKHLT